MLISRIGWNFGSIFFPPTVTINDKKGNPFFSLNVGQRINFHISEEKICYGYVDYKTRLWHPCPKNHNSTERCSIC